MAAKKHLQEQTVFIHAVPHNVERQFFSLESTLLLKT